MEAQASKAFVIDSNDVQQPSYIIKTNCLKFKQGKFQYLTPKFSHHHNSTQFLTWYMIFFCTLRIRSKYHKMMGFQDTRTVAKEKISFETIMQLTKFAKQRHIYEFLQDNIVYILNFDPFQGLVGIKWENVQIKGKLANKIACESAMIHKRINKIKTHGFDCLVDQTIRIARGQFSSNQRLRLDSICFCEAFICKNERIDVTFLIRPLRLPIVDPITPKLTGFCLKQQIKIYDYKYKRLNYKKQEKLFKAKMKLIQSWNINDIYACFLPDHILYQIPRDKRQKAATHRLQSIVDTVIDEISGKELYVPKQFEPQILTEQFAEKFVQDGLRWIYEKEFEHIVDKFKQVAEGLVDVISDENGALQLLKLIKSIPELKFKLTREQEMMIGTASNLLCLGRSGTGKTTCSALRLFSTNVYYRYMEELVKYNDMRRNKDADVVLPAKFKVNPQFMHGQSKLKLVFVTASPVLTYEVKKFYNDIRDHFTNQLYKKQQNKEQNEQPEETKFDITVVNMGSGDGSNTVITNEQDLKEYVKMEFDALAEDEDAEKQMDLPSSIDNLNQDHFPLFVSIKRLINMIDASLELSFFARNADGSIIGMSSNVEWHNESKGVFMINKYFKQSKNYEEKLKLLGKKLIHIDEQLESGNIQIDYEEDQELNMESNDADVFISGGALGAQMMDNMPIQNKAMGRQLSFEVDFDVFKLRFWPKVTQMVKIQPLVAWTEIYSTIKGGPDSYKYEDCILPAYIYTITSEKIRHKSQTVSFLTKLEKVQIYYAFMAYEKWKQEMNAYDFMDVVNHILIQSKQGQFNESQKIQFLMVDEVQDLTPNILRILMKLTEKNIFFCGDTAQTIAKGVGFRFYDLKQVFSGQSFDVPQVLQLSKNFRSHSRILDLANSVVSLVELLFPKTIDKLLKESSEFDGPKPIIIDPSKEEHLEQLLFGRSFKNLTQGIEFNPALTEQIQGSVKPQFGCNQVVIVRDQESKSKLPECLQNMLCLTVYEAKGLEFDDVIIYNFFEDSKCGSQWKLMQDVSFKLQQIKKKDGFEFLDFETLDINEQDQKFSNFESEQINTETIQTTVSNNTDELVATYQLKRERSEIYRKFAQLCTELKLLYVAITRPKKILIIYDQDNKHRKLVQDFWDSLGLVNVITKEMQQDQSLLKPEVANIFINNLSQAQTSLEEWRQQGIILFKKKFYLSALQCFKNSGDQDLEYRCLAYQHADKAAELKAKSDSLFSLSKNVSFKKSEREQYKTEAKETKSLSVKEMQQAGKFFEEIKMLKHAAQCYCSAKNVKKAALMFEEQKEYGQAAECYMQSKDLRKAADLYSKAQLFANAFECYEKLQDWEGLLMCLSKNKDLFKKEDRESYIESYFPIALNQLYQLYSNLDPGAENLGLSEENKGKFQEMRIKLKFQKSVSVIKEEDEELSDDSQEEEQDINDQKNYEHNNNPQQINDELQDEEESAYEIIDTSSHQEEQIEFIQTSQPTTNFQVQKDQSNDFEILSAFVDPDDEFLQSSKSVSIIESLISVDDRSSVLSNNTSEFSIINKSKIHSAIMSLNSVQTKFEEQKSLELLSKDNSMQSYFSGKQQELKGIIDGSCYSLINYERDTYAEDIVMQKLIYYISLFSEDVKQCLHELRSKDKLSHLEQTDSNESYFDNQYMMIDLDQISQELLNLILDILEHYELFMLCLIICNRYSLKEKLTRYIVSIGNKYSNLKQFKFTALQKFDQSLSINAQKMYSIVSHEAMHNVFGMIEHQFLNIDDKGIDKLSLRDQCFDSLLLQGLWRKLIFFMDVDSSLELCMATNDQNNFKLLYLVYKNGIKGGQEIKQLLNPNNYYDFKKQIQKDAPSKYKLLATEVSLLNEKQEFLDTIQKYNTEKFLTKEDRKYLMAIIKEIVVDGQNLFNENNKRQLSFSHEKRITVLLYSICQLVTSTQKKKNLDIFLKLMSINEQQVLVENLVKMTKFIQKQSYLTHLKISSIRNELKRVAYSNFGVSCIEELDIFQNYNGQYVIVKADSDIFKFVIQKQNVALKQFKKDILYKIYDENKHQYQDPLLQFKYINQLFQKQIKDIDSNINLQKIKIAFICDVNAELYMVPTQWIEEIISIQMVSLLIFNLSNNIYFQICFYEKVFKNIKDEQSNLTDKNQITNDYQQKLAYTRTISLIISGCQQTSTRIKLQESQTQSQALKQQLPNQILQLINDPKDIKNNELTANLKGSLQFLNELQQKFEQQIIQISSKVYAQDLLISESQFKIKKQLKIPPLEFQIILEKAIEQLKAAFQNIGNKERYFTNLLEAFDKFVLVDKYQVMLESLRGYSKQINKLINPQTKKDRKQLIQSAYLLLDSHVYLKCNAWTRSSESIFSFLTSAFNYIPFKTILNLVETAFYRALFSFFIGQTKTIEGVLIPDYAMTAFSLSSTYKCFALDQQQSIYEVIKVNYNDLQIETQDNAKMIGESFYWAGLLIEVLNKDEDTLQCVDIYMRVYNMIASCLINITRKELIDQCQIVKKTQTLVINLKNSSFNKLMSECLTHVSNISKQKWDSLQKSKPENKLFNYLKPINSQGYKLNHGFVRITCSALPEQNTNDIITLLLNTAFYQEQAELASRISASNYICSQWRYMKKLNFSLPKQTYQQKLLNLDYAGIIKRIWPSDEKSKNKESQIIQNNIVVILEQQETQIRQLMGLMQSNLVAGSLDLHYLKAKFILYIAKNREFTNYLNYNYVQSKNENEEKKFDQRQYIELNEEIEKQSSWWENETSVLEGWLSQKAMPNSLQMEKRIINIKGKWEKFVEFHKKKKIMLRHLKRNATK